jgi:adenosine deaminase
MSLVSTVDTQEKIIHFACKMPKVELHLHLEGTFKPEKVMEIAKRNNLQLPESYNSLEKLKKAYVFKDLFSFLDLYTLCGGVIRTSRDFEELMFDYLSDAYNQNIVHAEIAVGYPTHLGNGVPFDTIQNGVLAGMEKAKDKYGITSSIVIDIDRGGTEAEAEKILDLCKPHIGKSIVAIGLAYAENKNNNPGKFKNVYEKAHKLGLNKTAHAGEAMGADFVQEAVEVLKAERIDHGVRVLEDPSVVKLLVDKKIALTTCPLSNVCLKVYPSMSANRLRELIASNVIVTINSDDPAYFGGNLNENFKAIINELDFTLEEVYQLGKNSIIAAFLPTKEKDRLIEQLDNLYDRSKYW